MKIAVIGSRNFKDKKLLKTVLDAETQITELITGGAVGADTLAEKWAKEKSRFGGPISITIIKPNYEKFGKYAPLERNNKIIDSAEKVIAFWDGQSKGTQYVIKECQRLGKPLKVIKYQTAQISLFQDTDF